MASNSAITLTLDTTTQMKPLVQATCLSSGWYTKRAVLLSADGERE
jgi:hypothetical protein